MSQWWESGAHMSYDLKVVGNSMICLFDIKYKHCTVGWWIQHKLCVCHNMAFSTSIHRRLSTTKCTASKTPHPYVLWLLDLHQLKERPLPIQMVLISLYRYQRSAIGAPYNRGIIWLILYHRYVLSTLAIHQSSTTEITFTIFFCTANKIMLL